MNFIQTLINGEQGLFKAGYPDSHAEDDSAVRGRGAVVLRLRR